jgi:hypothetical protein
MAVRKKMTYWPPAADGVENIVAGLNESEPRFLQNRTRLRQLIKAWYDSGPNLEKMLQQDRELAHRVQRDWKVFLVPTKSGGAFLAFSPSAYESGLHRGEAIALHIFMNFLIHPQWERLGGPCARCDLYYIKKTRRQKVYCSKRCGRVSTAAAATRKALDHQKMEKLECAEGAIRLWEKGARQQPWKEFVSKRCGITPRFLTRAVNDRRLSEPDEKMLNQTPGDLLLGKGW